MANNNALSLAGVAIVVEQANETLDYAAAELSRFLQLLSGQASPIQHVAPEAGSFICLRTIAPGKDQNVDPCGDQGFTISIDEDHSQQLHITGATPSAVLHGVYRLLEELGMGFYAGGETYPDRPAAVAVPADLSITEQPVFAVRGNMLHYNFLCGPTNWGLADYKFYFDQLARMRCNMLIMHWYDGEPGAAYHVDGEYLAGGETPSALTKPWGAREALRTSQYYFDAGRAFDAEVFTSPMAADVPDLLSEIRESERVWQEATRYARRAGIGIAAGFEAPKGDPTDPAVMDHFKARLEQFLSRNPHLTHFALWQHESGGCFGTTPPEPGSAAAALLESQRDHFGYLGTDRRVWEAIRYGAFAQAAATQLAAERPELRLLVIGWGGDRWMRFADLCLGYDKILPESVVFCCHDNINASYGPEVSTPWGQLPAHRERWAMPWVEGDIDDCWVRQPNVEILGKLTPDALAKGCQGMLTLQWRTRDVEEETGYIAQFAWQPSLTPDAFYHRLAGHQFGPAHTSTWGARLGELQRMGARWTGVRGSVECSSMRWTGWTPHFPFEVNADACTFLANMTTAGATALATIPDDEVSGAGAFHERDENDHAEKPLDHSRLGVAEFQAATERLSALADSDLDETQLREALFAVEESIWAVRPALVADGMDSPCYHAVDGFLIAIHHLQRNAGATKKMARLQEIRDELRALRNRCEQDGQTARGERIDYLRATIDFALGYDAAAMQMADGETVEQALHEAEARQSDGDADAAAQIAANAYEELVRAGMQTAIQAFEEKLTTRCDFGTLTTIVVKALPLYWETVAKLEAFLPALPPRELRCRGFRDEVWISWTPGRASGQNLYRRRDDEANWTKLNAKPLAASSQMFVDRPSTSAVYHYTVSGLAEDGWESPRSHFGTARFGEVPGELRIVANKPYTTTESGEEFVVDTAVIAERDVASITLHWCRSETDQWQELPMRKRFRNCFMGALPDAAVAEPGLIKWYVEARDNEGQAVVWPEAARDGVPHTVAVLTPRQ